MQDFSYVDSNLYPLSYKQDIRSRSLLSKSINLRKREIN